MKKFLMSLADRFAPSCGRSRPGPVLSGQDDHHCRRHQSRRCLRSLPPDAGGVHAKVYSGQSQYYHPKRAGRGVDDCGESGVITSPSPTV